MAMFSITEPYWFQTQGKRYWKRRCRDWLCLRAAPGSPIHTLRLQDGTHHYFEDLHVFDQYGKVVLQQSLAAENSTEKSLEEWQNCTAIAQARFLPFARPPRKGEDEVEDCGAFSHAGRSNAILMQVGDLNPAGQGADDSSLTATEVYRKLLQRLAFRVTLKESDQEDSPFRLSKQTALPTCVYLVSESSPPPPHFHPEKIDLRQMEEAFPMITIAPQKLYPPVPEPIPDWLVALPVSDVGTYRGILGYAFGKSPLLSDLDFLRGSEFCVSWNWTSPAKWITADVSWWFYEGDQWSEKAQLPEPVTRQYLKDNGAIPLFTRGPEHNGRNIQVRLTPLVFGLPIPNQAIIADYAL